MQRYEGRNLPQLLDLLHDIVMPEPVALTPQTTGWLVAGIWLAVVLLIVCVHGYRRWQANRYRRDALGALEELRKREDAAADVARILKRTALTAYPRRDVASLYGAEWAAFLRQTAPRDARVDRHADELAAAAYRPGIDAAGLIDPAKRWVRVHRA